MNIDDLIDRVVEGEDIDELINDHYEDDDHQDKEKLIIKKRSSNYVDPEKSNKDKKRFVEDPDIPEDLTIYVNRDPNVYDLFDMHNDIFDNAQHKNIDNDVLSLVFKDPDHYKNGHAILKDYVVPVTEDNPDKKNPIDQDKSKNQNTQNVPKDDHQDNKNQNIHHDDKPKDDKEKPTKTVIVKDTSKMKEPKTVSFKIKGILDVEKFYNELSLLVEKHKGIFDVKNLK